MREWGIPLGPIAVGAVLILLQIPPFIGTILWLIVVFIAWYLCKYYPEACKTLVLMKKMLKSIYPHVRDPLLKYIVEICIDALEVGTKQKPQEHLRVVAEKLEKLKVELGV